MSPDRTAPASLRPTPAPRSAAPETPADGFAALLGAADRNTASARREHAPGSARERDDRRGGDVRRHDDTVADAGARRAGDPGRQARAAAGRDAAPQEAAARGGAEAAGAGAATGRAPEAVESVPAASGMSTATELVLPPAAPPAITTTQAEAALPGLASPLPVLVDGAAPPSPVAPLPPVPVHALPGTVASPPAAILPVADAPPASIPRPTVPEQTASLPGDPAAAAPAADATVDPAPVLHAPSRTEPLTAAQTAPTALAADPDGAGTARDQGSAPREQTAAARATTPAPAPAAPASPPTSAVPFTPLAHRAAPLHQAPRAVAQVLQVAVDRGISHAKLNLRPAELGGIEIRLQSSAAGVTAQVVADSPEAARLLHQAADDLRRSLERHDVTLLSLDVSTAGDDRPDGSAGASADLAGDRSRHFAAHGLTPPAAAEADEPTTVVATVQLPDGLHVDVLA
jgi:hypothetical protein